MPPRKRKQESGPKPVKKPKEPRPPRPFHTDGHQCALCPKIVANDSRQSHACHVHGELVLFECGYCFETYNGDKIRDVKEHILRNHEGRDPSNIIDHRGIFKEEIKKLKAKCFPPVEKVVVPVVDEEMDDTEAEERNQESNTKTGKSQSKADKLLAKELRSILQTGGPRKDLQCTLCSTTLFQTSSAERHALSHANLPLYECKYCNQKFSTVQKKTLYNHIRNEHKNLKERVKEDDYHNNKEKLKCDIQSWKQKCFPDI